MNSSSLLRNALVTLSLGAFLTSNAFAAQGNDEDNHGGMASALVPYTGIAQDDTDVGDAADTPFITVTEEGGTSTLVSLLPAGHTEAQIDLTRLDQKGSILACLDDNLIKLIFICGGYICKGSLSVRDTVALKETCYTFYHALRDARFDPALRLVQFLHHIPPEERSLAFDKGAEGLPLVLPKGDVYPYIFRKKLSTLDLIKYTDVLPEGFLAGASHLKTLNLYNYQHPLPTGFLAGAVNLEWLNIDNHPHALPAGFLDGAGNLTDLHLDNHPHALPEGLFAGATNLERLYLNDHTQALPERLFARVPTLEYLGLNFHTQALPERLLAGAGNLRWLNLDNHPHALPEGLFAGAPNLTVLHLDNLSYALPEGVFDALANLGALYLRNHTHRLPEGLLAGAANLRYLCLSGLTHTLPEGFAENLRARGVTVDL